jgi:GNAT superfamily N-acetyltransferase
MSSSSSVEVRRLRGEEGACYIDELARLRIEIFSGYPYLYAGDLEYEKRYLRYYLESEESVFVVAFDGERVVGVATGMPMEDADEAFQRPFLELGHDISRIFYFAESVLDPAYRGQGLGVRFFEEREAHVRSLGRFDWVCFAAVLRSPDHPLKPDDYQPLYGFWRKRGYQRKPELRATFPWKEVGSTEEHRNVMEFWIKKIGDDS